MTIVAATSTPWYHDARLVQLRQFVLYGVSSAAAWRSITGS
ncbi:hypothetical protein A7A08_02600 [Methyloligella halotolerans]|uniref:Uncharacterized protein n=1 Tax=Methyloligella halotolerans TaxID=1177755 RepID=A0A1E2RW69_9HYPH|nr:hypothetical protein [Methyloligella halotolerans]ODA66477.1 hypothetical protein A7A08_02600 [Methyloligella halotolerans]